MVTSETRKLYSMKWWCQRWLWFVELAWPRFHESSNRHLLCRSQADYLPRKTYYLIPSRCSRVVTSVWLTWLAICQTKICGTLNILLGTEVHRILTQQRSRTSENKSISMAKVTLQITLISTGLTRFTKPLMPLSSTSSFHGWTLPLRTPQVSTPNSCTNRS